MKEQTMKQKAKYQIIEDYVIEEIKNKHLKPGDQIETEMQLSQRFGIGRLTVNRALINLANAGYITRIPGKGSFVQQATISKNLITSKGSFSEDMRSIGLKPGSRLIEYRLVTGKEAPEAAGFLRLGPEQRMHYFVRVRTGDDTPIAVSYTYLSAELIPVLDVRALDGSLNEYLRSIGIDSSGGAEYKMSAHLPTERQKELLGVDEAALLRNAHVTYNADDVPYEYVETYYLCTRYEYTFSTRGNKDS